MNAQIQKQTAAVNASGVITKRSFLLPEKKFITVFSDRYAAKNTHMYLVTLGENHRGIIPPVCKKS